MSRKDDVKVTVYDHDNNPHLMTHLNARDMITHRNWSLTPVDKAAVAAGDSLLDALANASGKPADLKAIQKELDGKTKAEMRELAFERYGEKLDGRKAESEIIATILDLETAAQQKAPEEPEDERPEEPDAEDNQEQESSENEGAPDTTSTDGEGGNA